VEATEVARAPLLFVIRGNTHGMGKAMTQPRALNTYREKIALSAVFVCGGAPECFRSSTTYPRFLLSSHLQLSCVLQLCTQY
jgi:hypothetical protein